MPYLTIAGTTYGARVNAGAGRRIQVENRFRALDGSLVVDRIASKEEKTVTILDNNGTRLTITTAETLIDTLTAGNVTVGGDIMSGTCAAKDISTEDTWVSGAAVRSVTVTFEEV